MPSHRFPVASQPQDSRCRADEFFPLHSGFLLPWDGDLDQHARQFAELLHRGQLSPPMSSAALAGVAELLAADWHMNQGQLAELAVARSRVWRRCVVNHIWGAIGAAGHILEDRSGVDQVISQEHQP